MVSGLIPAQSSVIVKTIGLMLVGTSVDVDGEILVIIGVDGALNEKE